MANPFVHIELSTDDLSKAKEFYRGVFGWKLSDMPMGPGMTYTMVDVGTGVGGGMQAKPMPEAPTAWLPYVEVDNVDTTIGKARQGGAHVIVERQEVPGMGALGIFVDPTGAMLGVWQSTRKAPAAKPAAKKTAKKAAPKKAAPKKAAKKSKKR
jgi:predicted enzyme related to lactoylglutathione lyase